MAKKTRLDELALQQGLADNIELIRSFIMAGKICTGDRVWNKAGEKIPTDTQLQLKGSFCKWVSRGGLKLEKALKDFAISVKNLECIDIGASNGGFTDVLLYNSARKVVALDVGYGLLDLKLQKDPRVVVKDRENFKYSYENFIDTPFDLAVTDLSFISLRTILPKISQIIKEDGFAIALIKPQFEAPSSLVPEGGIITDPNLQTNIISKLATDVSKEGLYLHSLTSIPIVSKKKNIEFPSLWRKIPSAFEESQIAKIVNQAHIDQEINK